ncbi:MAG: hypothetical protein PUB21_04880 [Bacteroidales bacterium]|nr:hypothetical protein [Bacteroidales bacterium]
MKSSFTVRVILLLFLVSSLSYGSLYAQRSSGTSNGRSSSGSSSPAVQQGGRSSGGTSSSGSGGQGRMPVDTRSSGGGTGNGRTGSGSSGQINRGSSSGGLSNGRSDVPGTSGGGNNIESHPQKTPSVPGRQEPAGSSRPANTPRPVERPRPVPKPEENVTIIERPREPKRKRPSGVVKRPVYKPGTFVSRIPKSAVKIYFDGIHYHYDQGIYYRLLNNMYMVCRPPIGVVVDFIPTRVVVATIDITEYEANPFTGRVEPFVRRADVYYDNGVFYIEEPTWGFRVIEPVIGAWVSDLPIDKVRYMRNGRIYYSVAGANYLYVREGNEDWYIVVSSDYPHPR